MLFTLLMHYVFESFIPVLTKNTIKLIPKYGMNIFEIPKHSKARQ